MGYFTFETRFSYPKTESFWESINNIINESPIGSTDRLFVSRDYLFFTLCYSYGLRGQEALNLTFTDLNFCYINKNSDEYGSIFVQNDTSGQNRLIYPLYEESIQQIENLLSIINLYSSYKKTLYIFTTSNGNRLNLQYMNNRLKNYNNKISTKQIVPNLNTFRQFYIADILRIKGLSQSFINKQIGNNVLNNQIYSHLFPEYKNGVVSNEF